MKLVVCILHLLLLLFAMHLLVSLFTCLPYYDEVECDASVVYISDASVVNIWHMNDMMK